MATSAVKLFIDPPTHHFLGDRLFIGDDAGRLNGDRQEAPYVHLRERFAEQGMEVHTADLLPARIDLAVLNVYFSLGRLDALRSFTNRPDVVPSAFFAMECPIVEPSLYRSLPKIQRHFRRLYSWSDSASLERFTGRALKLRPFRWPQSFDRVHESLWCETDGRGFLVMINANKLPRVYWRELYTERMRAVAFFERTGDIDLYGKGWDAPSIRVGRTWVPWTVKRPWLAVHDRVVERFPNPLLVAARRAWRGPALSKAKTLARYDFALCFENCTMQGWITEKLFDCLFAGTVPVYWGAPEIRDLVPPECFIDMRDFPDYAALRDFLKSRSRSEVDRYREAGRAFVGSDRYRQFSRAAFTALFEECVAEAIETRAERADQGSA